ncbi:hypothetical protein FXO37_12477 [Capsicum annuum]|nr:hypothetical protein FXO37_12477 [Capsicum annuum]
MRDVVHDHGSKNVPLWTDQLNDVMEPGKVLEDMIMKDEETTSLVVEVMMEQDEPPIATSAEVQEFNNTQISFGHHSHNVVLKSIPPLDEPKAKGRRRNLVIDDNIKNGFWA